jgi:hypothetical protein
MSGVKKMSRIKVVLSVVALALVVVSLGVPLVAQDATATPADSTGEMGTGTLTNCDSSLILLAGLAQRFFGFTGGTDLDMTTFEYGQYTPLFDMSGMSGTMGGTEPSMSATAEVMATAEAMVTVDPMAPTPMTSSVFLNPPMLADENVSCTQLRASLEAFFAAEFMNPDWDARFRGGMGGRGTAGASG